MDTFRPASSMSASVETRFILSSSVANAPSISFSLFFTACMPSLRFSIFFKHWARAVTASLELFANSSTSPCLSSSSRTALNCLSLSSISTAKESSCPSNRESNSILPPDRILSSVAFRTLNLCSSVASSTLSAPEPRV